MQRSSSFLHKFGDWVRDQASAFGDGGAVGTVQCGSEADAPIVMGGHTHIHQAGFGILVPDGWIAFDLWHPDLAAAMDDYDEESRSVLEGQRPTTTLLAGDLADWRHNIYVDTWPVDDLTLEGVPAMRQGADERHYSDIRREPIVLPSGRALHTRMSRGPECSEEVASFDWIHSGRYYMLDCVDSTRHDALWLQIAESFEFLTPG